MGHDWLVYDRSGDVVGLGATYLDALKDALRRSPLVPGDFGLIGWEHVPPDCEAWRFVPDWSACEQLYYRVTRRWAMARKKLDQASEGAASVLDRVPSVAQLEADCAALRRELARCESLLECVRRLNGEEVPPDPPVLGRRDVSDVWT